WPLLCWTGYLYRRWFQSSPCRRAAALPSSASPTSGSSTFSLSQTQLSVNWPAALAWLCPTFGEEIVRTRELVDQLPSVSPEGVSAPAEKQQQDERLHLARSSIYDPAPVATPPPQRLCQPQANPQASPLRQGPAAVIKTQNLRVEFNVREPVKSVKVAVVGLNLHVAGGGVRLSRPKRRGKDHHDERVAGLQQRHQRRRVALWRECARPDSPAAHRLSAGTDLLLQVSHRRGVAPLLRPDFQNSQGRNRPAH